MKKIQRFLFIAILGIASNVKAGSGSSDYKTVVDAFIQSRINTDYQAMKAILSDEAVEKLPRLKKTYRFSASDMLATMKANQGVQQPCTPASAVLAESQGMAMVRVDFNYGDQVTSEFLTLERNDREEWKVTQINKFFGAAPETKETAPLL